MKVMQSPTAEPGKLGSRAGATSSGVRSRATRMCAHTTQSGFDTKAVGASKLAAALQVAGSLLWIPQAAAIGIAIGDLARAQGGRTLWLVLAVLLIGMLRAALEAIGARCAFLAARKSVSIARARAAEALSARSPLDIERAASGRAGSVMAEQAEMIVPYLARYSIAQARVAIVPPLIFLAILPLSWAAALVLLIAAPLIPLFMVLIGWQAKEASEAQLVEAGGMNAFLLDRLRGLATIRALDAVDATAARLRANAENLRRRTMAVLRIAFLSSAVLELFAALGVAMVAVYVGFHLLGQLPFGAWGGKLSLSEGLFILLLAPAFFEPLRELATVWHDRAAGQAALDELDRLTADGRQILGGGSAAPGARCAEATAADVHIENVSFRHGGSAAATFEDLNLAVAPGEHVALLGPSGSGKSSLLALIAGLATAQAGRIIIGGETLRDDNASVLRAGMAWIGQRPHIFAGTLESNVALGRPGISRADIAAALAFAKLTGIAQARGPALIGENGVGLSGGEALRLALARIAAGGGQRLILADEPTAHLDQQTAHEITEELIAIARGRTLIVATHDPVLAARMDRIVRLEDLRLEEAA